MFEVFEHTADLGLRIEASSCEQLFIDAAHGLQSVLIANPESVRGVQERQVRVAGDALDYLLFDWLNELLYLYDTEHLLWRDFTLHFEPNAREPHAMHAVCRGEPVDSRRHALQHEVKAITYHGLVVERSEHGWRAELIVDI